MKQLLNAVQSFLLSTLRCRSIHQRNACSKYLFVLLLAGIGLFNSSCQKEGLQQGLLKKQGIACLQINFTQPGLFPEGVTYDPFLNWFYVSSAAYGTVGIVKRDGTYTPFITDSKLTGTTGLKVDNARKRLMVSNVENGIGAYDLNTGDRIFFTDLSALLPGAPVFINDLALDPQGNAYVTNSASPVIYKVDGEGNATIFFQNEAFATAPGGFGFNGIQYEERGFLLVAFSDQIIKIPVRNPGSYSNVQLNAPVFPDGLLLSKNGKQLIVVSNTGGTPDDKVLSFISNDQWKSGSLSTTFYTGAVFPTTATSDGKSVYVLYAHLDKLINGQNQDNFTIQEVPLKNKSPF